MSTIPSTDLPGTWSSAALAAGMLPIAVASDGAKAHRLQRLAEGLWPGGGVFNELDPFHPQHHPQRRAQHT